MAFSSINAFTVVSNRSFSNHGQTANALFGIGNNKQPEVITKYENIDKTFDSILEQLNELVDSYSLARFDQVNAIFDTPNFDTEIGNQLKVIQTNIGNDGFQNKLRELLKHTFEGIQQSVIQYGNFINAIEKLERCKEKSSILDDSEKLLAYIKEQNKKFSLFVIPDISSVKAELKPEYARYIQLHGFPEGSVFDTDKLHAIRVELGIE